MPTWRSSSWGASACGARSAAPGVLALACALLAGAACGGWVRLDSRLPAGDRYLGEGREVVRGGARLEVTVRGAVGEARVHVLLFEEAAASAFPAAAAALEAVSVGPAAGRMRVVFTDLPPGRHAVFAWQDLDGDSALSLGPFGAPAEPWGASGGSGGRLAPPRFERAAFRLDPPGARVDLALHR